MRRCQEKRLQSQVLIPKMYRMHDMSKIAIDAYLKNGLLRISIKTSDPASGYASGIKKQVVKLFSGKS